MKLFFLLVTFLLMDANVPMAQADLVVYNVTAVFNEPMLQPVNTTFTGSFIWDANLKQITNLQGSFNQAMIGASPTVKLIYQNASAADGSEGIVVTVFIDTEANQAT